MTCRTCRFLFVAPDARGRRVVRKDRSYPCVYELPDQPMFPMSVTKSYSFRWPPSRNFMEPDGGEGCLCYQKLMKTAAVPAESADRAAGDRDE